MPKSTIRKIGVWAGGGLLVLIVCAVIGRATGILPDTFATQTAEAEQLAAENNLTATIIALTPSDTPTPSNTPTASDTPTSTFTPSVTPIPTDTRTPSNTIEATPIPDFTATPIIATAAPSGDFSVEPLSATRYINSGAGRVNLRAGPGTNYEIVGQLNNRAEIRITGITDDETWYRIEYEDVDDDTAWVFASLTSSEPVIAAPPSNGNGGSSGSGGNGGSSSNPYDIDPNNPYSTCDMSICSNYPPLRRCADKDMEPWAALDARQIACCWRGRDGDSDGLACFGT